jgi:hypothetical protein
MNVTFRKVSFCLVLSLSLLACQKPSSDATEQKQAAPVVVLTAPTDGDPEAWKAYLRQEITPHVDRRFKRPYTYLIPLVDQASPEHEEQQRQYDAQFENVQNVVGRGIQAGTMLAFGGPDSKSVGNVIVESFRLAGPKTLKGVRVLVIAKPEERERVTAAVAPSEAELVWVDMK